jgi:hypothetical protein
VGKQTCHVGFADIGALKRVNFSRSEKEGKTTSGVFPCFFENVQNPIDKLISI